MLTAEIVRPESGRYAATLVCVPGLWAGPPVWRGFTSYLAHRGWESHLLDVRPVSGGTAARGAAVAEYAASLTTPAVLVGHDAGGLVALAAGAVHRPVALVLLAPLAPGSTWTRALTVRRGALGALVLSRPVPPPTDDGAALACGELPDAARAALLAGFAAEPAAAVVDVARARTKPTPVPGVPTLVAVGDRDPLLPAVAALAFAGTIGGEHRALPGLGHWCLAGAGWEQAVGVVHRWLVERLGEGLLELYPEAMADRDADEDGGD